MTESSVEKKENVVRGELPNEYTVLEYLKVLVQHRRTILLIVLLSMSIVAGISFLLDKWYESKIVILMPEKNSSPIESLGGALGGLTQNLIGSINSNPQRYLAIIKSRRIKEAIIQRFDLIKVFDLEPISKDTVSLIETLDEIIVTEINVKTSTITVTVHFKNDPQMSADIANYVAVRLDEINRELSTEQAKSSRKFIESRYHEARETLRKSEDSLIFFQKKYGIVALPEQTKASIEAAAGMQAQIVASETEYNILKRTLSENHPELLKTHMRLQELLKMQKKIELGDRDIAVFIPFNNAPDISLRYMRLYREIQINQKVTEFLVPQYEQAKIQEAKDTPTLLVLDSARPAAYPFKPKKKILTIISGVFTLFFMCVIVIQLNKWKTRDGMNEVRLLIQYLKPSNFFRKL